MINISHLEGVEGAVGPLRGLLQKWGFTGFHSWGQRCQLSFLFKIMIFCLCFSRVSFLNFPSGMRNEQLTFIVSGVINSSTEAKVTAPTVLREEKWFYQIMDNTACSVYHWVCWETRSENVLGAVWSKSVSLFLLHIFKDSKMCDYVTSAAI